MELICERKVVAPCFSFANLPCLILSNEAQTGYFDLDSRASQLNN